MTLPPAPDFLTSLQQAQALMTALPGHLNAMAEALNGLSAIEAAVNDLSQAMSLLAPAGNVWPIAPSDTAEISQATRAIYIGTGGTVVLRAVDSPVDTAIVNVPDGAILDIRAVAIRETGTTASNIVGLS